MSPKRTGWERARVASGMPETDGGFGRAIAGRGYYVWDEDPREALLWARELGLSRPPDPATSTDGEDSTSLD